MQVLPSTVSDSNALDEPGHTHFPAMKNQISPPPSKANSNPTIIIMPFSLLLSLIFFLSSKRDHLLDSISWEELQEIKNQNSLKLKCSSLCCNGLNGRHFIIFLCCTDPLKCSFSCKLCSQGSFFLIVYLLDLKVLKIITFSWL